MGNTLRVNCDARQLQQQSQTCSLSHTYPDLVNVMDVSNKCKCIFLYFFQPCLCLQSFSVKWQIQNPFGCFPLPCLIYINRYFILQFDRLFFNLIYTPSINWSGIWRSEGVSAVLLLVRSWAEKMNSESNNLEWTLELLSMMYHLMHFP